MEESSGCLTSYGNVEYSTRSYVEMPQSGEVNYISTIVGVRGNPVYKGKGIWVSNTHLPNSSTIKVDKDDIRAKRHYVKTLTKEGKEVKIWECGLCGKEFKFQYTLVRHIPTHTDVRNYQCDICPKAFRQLSTLAQHKATHLNMRPFTCDYCKKSFNRISTLISHKKIHYDEKRHVCPYCGKGFHQKGNLRNHMYTHTNERPYKCEICHKGFNQKSNLVCHKVSTHARKILHQCDICSLSFTKPHLYTTHMESVHNIAVKMSKKCEATQLLRQNLESEAQCALVDESNNIIYRLPVSQGNITPRAGRNGRNVASIGTFKQTDSQKENNHGNEILTIVKHIPTEAMNQLEELGQVPFVLLYQPGDSQPKICKAITQPDQYALVHPCSNDISKYFIANSNSLSHKFPIVSTVIQKKDANGRVQTLVLPAGLHPQIVDSYEGANGQNVFAYYKSLNRKINDNFKENISPNLSEQQQKSIENVGVLQQRNKNNRTAVIYTKTQPNIRNSKNFVLTEAQSESKKENYPLPLNIPSMQDPLDHLTTEDPISDDETKYKTNNEDPQFSYVFLPDNTGNTNIENIVMKDANDNYSIDPEWTAAYLNKCTSNLYATQATAALNEVTNPANYDLMKENNFQTSLGYGLLDFGEELNHCCKEESNLESITDINLRKETIKHEVLEPQNNIMTDNPCCDIEPTLFNNLEPLKESLSKYNIDFDGDAFDLFDDCGFSGSLMDNMNNNNVEEDTKNFFNLQQNEEDNFKHSILYF
ncbi:uncharacterized protein isoform X1 [Rhodnius prolixus]|uniref:uncharacterized protein isoform X1 n=1 Tax=Rhodnius prolixus TaxID=13249 RepID=UPI003D18B68F